jgi:hypothetical protein
MAMTRALRVLLFRVLPVLVLLELGLRVEWIIREQLSKPSAKEGEVRLLVLGNSLAAGYPQYLRAAIDERLRSADIQEHVTIEELVMGKQPSNQLVQALEARLYEGPVDIVISLIGAYDRKAKQQSQTTAKSQPPRAAQSSPVFLLRPMFVSVVRGAFQGWIEELQQQGLGGTFRPDERAIFHTGTQSGLKHVTAPKTSRSPNTVKIGWRAREESRRAVASQDVEAIAEGFSQVLVLGWEAAYTTNEFMAARLWYQSISTGSDSLLNGLIAQMPAHDEPIANSLLQLALAFERREYSNAVQLGSQLPETWLGALGSVHAKALPPAEFDQFLAAAIAAKGLDAFAINMRLYHLVEQDESDEVLDFLTDVIRGEGPIADLNAVDGAIIKFYARVQLTNVLVSRARCGDALKLGLPVKPEQHIHTKCLEKRVTMDTNVSIYTEVTTKSYQRLLELGRKHGFSTVAVHYPARPVADLLATMPPSSQIPVVDNHPSFLAAIETHGYLGVFAKKIGFHLTPLGDKLLADNIFEVLIAKDLIPGSDLQRDVKGRN